MVRKAFRESWFHRGPCPQGKIYRNGWLELGVVGYGSELTPGPTPTFSDLGQDTRQGRLTPGFKFLPTQLPPPKAGASQARDHGWVLDVPRFPPLSLGAAEALDHLLPALSSLTNSIF